MTQTSNTSTITSILMTMVAALILGSTITGFVELPQVYYYGSVFIMGALLFPYNFDGIIGLKSLWAFVLFCAISIFLNQPPAYFKAWSRFAGFIIIIVTLAPLFISSKANSYRITFLNSTLWLCVILSSASFFCYFLNINFYSVHPDMIDIGYGHFSGLLRHSMLLGPIAGISAIYAFASFLGKEHNPISMLFITGCCLGSCLLSASRGALTACVISLLSMTFIFFRNKKSRGFIYIIIIVAFIGATYPLWNSLTEFVLAKQEQNVQSGGTFSSRESLWMARIAEIKSHPLTGVGFCCVDPRLTPVNTQTGVIEPGSSWLAIFSMTGILGFLSFIIVFYKTFHHAYSLSSQTESAMFCGCLIFFAIHFITEGYILASGSILGLVFWLLVGCVWGKKGEQ